MKDFNLLEVVGNVYLIEIFGVFDGLGFRYVLFL